MVFIFIFFIFSFSQLELELGYTLSGFTCLFLVLLLTKNTNMNPGKVFSVKPGWDAPLTEVTDCRLFCSESLRSEQEGELLL